MIKKEKLASYHTDKDLPEYLLHTTRGIYENTIALIILLHNRKWQLLIILAMIGIVLVVKHV